MHRVHQPQPAVAVHEPVEDVLPEVDRDDADGDQRRQGEGQPLQGAPAGVEQTGIKAQYPDADADAGHQARQDGKGQIAEDAPCMPTLRLDRIARHQRFGQERENEAAADGPEVRLAQRLQQRFHGDRPALVPLATGAVIDRRSPRPGGMVAR